MSRTDELLEEARRTQAEIQTTLNDMEKNMDTTEKINLIRARWANRPPPPSPSLHEKLGLPEGARIYWNLEMNAFRVTYRDPGAARRRSREFPVSEKLLGKPDELIALLRDQIQSWLAEK